MRQHVLRASYCDTERARAFHPSMVQAPAPHPFVVSDPLLVLTAAARISGAATALAITACPTCPRLRHLPLPTLRDA